MDVHKDFLPKVQRIPSKDETFSYSGTKDFEKPEEGDVRTLDRKISVPRSRTRNSLNNSYT